MAAAVEARGLVKRFGSITAVDGIDLSLVAGAHLRPARAQRLGQDHAHPAADRPRHSPPQGEAVVLGDRMPSAARLARIGYMTQSDGLYPELSVWENIRFFGALYGVTDRDRLTAALETVRMADRADATVLDLSGGMRRRVSLACRPGPSARGAVPRRAHRGYRPHDAGPVLGPLPAACRRGHHDPGVQPRDGRGGPLRRAGPAAQRQGGRPRHGRADPRACRDAGPGGRLPQVRRVR